MGKGAGALARRARGWAGGAPCLPLDGAGKVNARGPRNDPKHAGGGVQQPGAYNATTRNMPPVVCTCGASAPHIAGTPAVAPLGATRREPPGGRRVGGPGELINTSDYGHAKR